MINQVQDLIDSIAKVTGIPVAKLGTSAKLIINCPDSLGLTKAQTDKIKATIALSRKLGIVEFLQETIALDSSTKSAEYCMKLSKNETEKEYTRLILLNSQNHLIDTITISEGTLNECAIYPREIIKAVISHNANAVILTHNHPSNTLKPSQCDLDVTKKISNALETINVRLLDHIITTSESTYFSMAEKGML